MQIQLLPIRLETYRSGKHGGAERRLGPISSNSVVDRERAHVAKANARSGGVELASAGTVWKIPLPGEVSCPTAGQLVPQADSGER